MEKWGRMVKGPPNLQLWQLNTPDTPCECTGKSCEEAWLPEARGIGPTRQLNMIITTVTLPSDLPGPRENHKWLWINAEWQTAGGRADRDCSLSPMTGARPNQKPHLHLRKSELQGTYFYECHSHFWSPDWSSRNPLYLLPICPPDTSSQSHRQDGSWHHLLSSGSSYHLLKHLLFHPQPKLRWQINSPRS